MLKQSLKSSRTIYTELSCAIDIDAIAQDKASVTAALQVPPDVGYVKLWERICASKCGRVIIKLKSAEKNLSLYQFIVPREKVITQVD